MAGNIVGATQEMSAEEPGIVFGGGVPCSKSVVEAHADNPTRCLRVYLMY